MRAWYNVEVLVEVKTAKKILGPKVESNRAKLNAKLFFAIFSSLVDYFSFKLYKMIAWNNV